MASSTTQTILGDAAFTPFGEHYNMDLSGYDGYFAGNLSIFRTDLVFGSVQRDMCGTNPSRWLVRIAWKDSRSKVRLEPWLARLRFILFVNAPHAYCSLGAVAHAGPTRLSIPPTP